MKTAGQAAFLALRQAAALTRSATPQPLRTSGAAPNFKSDLAKAREKFLGRPNSAPPPMRRPAAAPRAYSSGRLQQLARPPFAQLAGMYEGSTGRLRHYALARVTDSAEVVSWAANNGLLPDVAHSIVDIGAAQGGAVVRLGRHYPDAAILALDPDPQSAEFIGGRIKGGQDGAVVPNPGRIGAFTGTMPDALAQGRCKENSVSLVNMQAVAPYLSDEELAHNLQAIHRALEPGGQVMLSCYGELHHQADAGKRNLHLRTDIAMLDMLAGAGFTVKCVGNALANEGGRFEKTCHEMDDVLAQKSMPAHPPGHYWHTVNIVAVKA
jgi:hypothetical protein